MAQAGLVDIARRLSEVRPDGANLPRRDVGPVVAGLAAVVGGVSPADIGRKALGATAVSALRTLQARAGLPETGEVDAPTLSRLRAEVTDKHVTTSAFRTAKVQEMLVVTCLSVTSARSRLNVGASTSPVSGNPARA